ncbi:MAG: hypothetical protein ACLRVU_11375 [Beduini sp.]|uniref:hypothetical protein n=1 Tax=Beduini sp. TaxID=1922300 RepID=UPI00399F1A21
MIKKITLIFIALFILAGCSSRTEIISSPLNTTVSAINNSDEAYAEIDKTKKTIKLPIELDISLETTNDKIDISNPKSVIYSTHNGGVYVIGLYEENNNKYLITYAYSLSSTLDKVVIPKNLTNVTIYKANDEVVEQIKDISLKD